MKKISAIIITSILVLSLVGCSNDKFKNNTKPNLETTTNTSNVDKETHKTTQEETQKVEEELVDLTSLEGVYAGLEGHEGYLFISDYDNDYNDTYKERDEIIKKELGSIQYDVDELHTPHLVIIEKEIQNMEFKDFMSLFLDNPDMHIWECKNYLFTPDSSINTSHVKLGYGEFTYEDLLEILPVSSSVYIEFTSNGEEAVMYRLKIRTEELEDGSGSKLSSLSLDVDASDAYWENFEYDTQLYFRDNEDMVDFNTHKTMVSDSDMDMFINDVMDVTFTK